MRKVKSGNVAIKVWDIGYVQEALSGGWARLDLISDCIHYRSLKWAAKISQHVGKVLPGCISYPLCS